jgi:hypothetical protein
VLVLKLLQAVLPLRPRKANPFFFTERLVLVIEIITRTWLLVLHFHLNWTWDVIKGDVSDFVLGFYVVLPGAGSSDFIFWDDWGSLGLGESDSAFVSSYINSPRKNRLQIHLMVIRPRP